MPESDERYFADEAEVGFAGMVDEVTGVQCLAADKEQVFANLQRMALAVTRELSELGALGGETSEDYGVGAGGD